MIDLEELDSILSNIRRLDEQIQELRKNVPETKQDAKDHLQQIHFRLTECKGHLGSVRYDLAHITVIK